MTPLEFLTYTAILCGVAPFLIVFSVLMAFALYFKVEAWLDGWKS